MIIVADDDPLVQHTCKHCLEAAGYRVTLVDSGAGALRAVMDGKASVVLLDIFMPDMDGIETLISIKKESPSTPVIVMTGGGSRVRMDFLDAAKRLGADDIVQKPFTAEHLLSILKPFKDTFPL